MGWVANGVGRRSSLIELSCTVGKLLVGDVKMFGRRSRWEASLTIK